MSSSDARPLPAEAITVPAQIEYTGKPSSSAQADLIRRPKGERMRRATLSWLACWGLAVAAVFIPVLHFVLVPALVIAGPLLGMARLSERATLERVTGACPACDHALALALKGKLAESVPFRCEACGRPLELAPDRAKLAELAER